MRKADREINDESELESILRKAIVCRIAFADSNEPYVVPVNFGFEGRCLYFHSAPEGRKIDIIRRNNRVCFEVDVDHELVKGKTACKWGMRYRSVIGFGRAFLVEDLAGKRRALDVIMLHYSGELHEYPDDEVEGVAIVRVEIDSMTGKQSGYKRNPGSNSGD